MVALVIGASTMTELKRGVKATVARAADGRRELEVQFQRPREVRGFRIRSISDIPMWGDAGHRESFEFEILDANKNVIATRHGQRPTTSSDRHRRPGQLNTPAECARRRSVATGPTPLLRMTAPNREG